MKRLLTLVVLSLVLASSIVSAQTVTCSVTGASTQQATLYARFLAATNAERVALGLTPFSSFSEHCGFVMLSAFQSYVAQQQAVDAAKVGGAATAHGDETALPAHCTAAGLAAGCTKAQVACFVLSGNTTCN